MEVTLEEWIEITREEDVIDPEDADDPAWAPAKGCALWGRKKESDFKSLTDSPKGMKKMFETDWAACMYRFTFVDFLAKDLVVRSHYFLGPVYVQNPSKPAAFMHQPTRAAAV